MLPVQRTRQQGALDMDVYIFQRPTSNKGQTYSSHGLNVKAQGQFWVLQVLNADECLTTHDSAMVVNKRSFSKLKTALTFAAPDCYHVETGFLHSILHPGRYISAFWQLVGYKSTVLTYERLGSSPTTFDNLVTFAQGWVLSHGQYSRHGSNERTFGIDACRVLGLPLPVAYGYEETA